MKSKYNKTQLNPDSIFTRHVFHRDQFAHYLRWTHVLKRAKIGMKILDFGCANGNLLEVLYRNMYKGEKYLGLDIRKQLIKNTSEKFKNVKWAQFKEKDLCEENIYNLVGNNWDIICSFEVIEHIGKVNVDKFLKNIYNCCNENTEILISTPNYDENVGAAKNHIINGEVGEFTYDELKEILEKYFIIKEVYGTFASQKDYKKEMNDWQIKTFESLNKYYDSNLIANIMAPIMDAKLARNCLWVLVKK